MKVLFAVSNEEISQAIIKKYQKEYKEIISHKNVYYFNAILKEIQKDKSYDRIVISEDLEAFSHTQYDQIDKFIFEKLDSISDEASNMKGNDIPIILICLDRRTKSEQMLVKLFGIGIYNAILGNDRSVDEVCRLIHRPRLKKEAKAYYKIDSEEVTYQAENENDVSEMEIQNILAHYKSLGKDEDRYVDSFNNIAAQYNDTQLRIITKFLPLNVRAVLEEKSPKYQKIMSFNSKVSNSLRQDKKKEAAGTSEKLLRPKDKTITMTKPVVIPSSVNMTGVKKMSKPKKIQEQPQTVYQGMPQQSVHQVAQQAAQQSSYQMEQQAKAVSPVRQEENLQTNHIETEKEIVETPSVSATEEVAQVPQQPVKRGRGRPRKNPIPVETTQEPKPAKRGRGRPRKNPAPVEEETILPGFEEPEENTVLPGFDETETEENDMVLPGFEDNNNDTILPGFQQEDDDDDTSDSMLPGFEDDMNNDAILPGFDDQEEDDDDDDMVLPGFEKVDSTSESHSNYQEEPSFNYSQNMNQNSYNNNSYQQNYQNTYDEYVPSNIRDMTRKNNNYVQTIDISSLLTSDKKIVTFVGTSKNGTSFIVNNVAQLLSSMGINVAILDTTVNRNSYYIYTKNEEALRNIAANSIEQLSEGIANGIQVNKNLTVFTSLPDEQDSISRVDEILETLVKNYSLILIDCDFNTPVGYFKQSLETYLVQSLDILTIQPLTAFLRELKAKNILEEGKLKIILNKFVKIKGINEKTIIGGMAFYNDPAMSFMTELFDRNLIKYITIPFEEEIYIKYLEGIINCDINLKGYSKNFMQVLKSLGNMIYPLVSGQGTYRPPTVGGENNQSGVFSPSMNNTLNQMKRNF